MRRPWLVLGFGILLGMVCVKSTRATAPSAPARTVAVAAAAVETSGVATPAPSLGTPIPIVEADPEDEIDEERAAKIIDEDNLCEYSRYEPLNWAVFRAVMVKRIPNSLWRSLFTDGKDFEDYQDRSAKVPQFYLALYHAKLLSKLGPPKADYEEAMVYLNRAIASDPENGALYLYKAYIIYLHDGLVPEVKIQLFKCFERKAYFNNYAIDLMISHRYLLGSPNVTSFLAATALISTMPIPNLVPQSFYETVLKDATPDEMAFMLKWALAINGSDGKMAIERKLTENLIRKYYPSSILADGPMPKIKPWLKVTSREDDIVGQLAYDELKQPVCDRNLMDQIFKKCQREICNPYD